MKSEKTFEDLMRWRLAEAATGSPAPPSATCLLELIRPWWEIWPAQFLDAVDRLGQINLNYGHAMETAGQYRGGHPVPVLIVGEEDSLKSSARVLYLDVRDGEFRLRFRLAAAGLKAPQRYEVTFIGADQRPLFSAEATLFMNNEYHLASELPEDLAELWKQLKVTDKLPFRLIIRPVKAAVPSSTCGHMCL
ncbi:MAG TPA: hypothetical protein VG347_10230 [Verrucomicrobiae bacterium]|nr:hypothetical protein [Verrucomicrobiae bacterium]